VVGGGKVFCLDNRGDKETLVAVNAGDGTELWHAPIDDVISDGVGSSPRGTPVVDGQRVYVQSCRGEFQCLNTADGKIIWRVNFVKDFEAIFIGEKGAAAGASRHGYTGPPLVDGDRIIVGVGGTHGASVVCFDKASGKVLWKSQDDVPGYGGPVIVRLGGRQEVVSYTAQGLMGLDASDGKLLWRVPVKTSYSRHVTTPIACDDVVVIASHEVGLLGYQITESGAKAQQAWIEKDLAINFSSPVMVGHYLYGLGPKKKLICVDMPTGKLAWSKGGVLTGAGGFASFLVMHENILVLADDGRLILFAADPKECRVLDSVKVCGKNWCNPAYADGRLFLRDSEALQCVQLLP
jgi:outer membrane protein assembly factor BamB